MDKARMIALVAMHARISAAFSAANLPRGTLHLILRDREGRPVGETAVEVQGFLVVMSNVEHALN